jgi:uncharacterized OB-fold protein
MDVKPGMVEVLRCGACGALDAGPREICPRCHEAALQRHAVAGEGTLLTWTVIRRPPAAFRAEGSYAVAVIELDAGVKVTGRLEAPDDVKGLGARVKLVRSKDGVAIFRAA